MANLTLIAFPLLAICLPLSASYPIRLGRPDIVGSVLMVQAKGTKSIKGKTRVGGLPVPFSESSMTIALNFRWEVLEANALRKATKLKLTLGKGTCLMDGASLELPPEGSVIEVRYEEEKDVFLKDGFPLPKKIQKAIGMVVQVGEGKDEDDLQYGTGTPKEVGDSWSVNGESILVRAGREMGLIGDTKNVVGTCRLESVQKDEGVDCLKVSVQVEIHDAKGAFFINKESGFKLDKASIVLDQNGLFPIDPELQPHAYHIHHKFVGKYSGEIGEKGAKARMEMEMEIEQIIEIKNSPLVNQ